MKLKEAIKRSFYGYALVAALTGCVSNRQVSRQDHKILQKYSINEKNLTRIPNQSKVIVELKGVLAQMEHLNNELMKLERLPPSERRLQIQRIKEIISVIEPQVRVLINNGVNLSSLLIDLKFWSAQTVLIEAQLDLK